MSRFDLAPANDNVVTFRRHDKPVRAFDMGLVEDTIAVSEMAIQGVREKLHDLSMAELGLMWNRMSTAFNMAPCVDHVSDAIMLLLEAELDSRETDGGGDAA